MTRILGLVEVDLAAQGSPEKIFSRRLGGKSVLEWVVRQVTDCERLDRVVVLSQSTPADDPIWDCVPLDVPVIYPAGNDALARTHTVTDYYQAEAVVRVGTQTPFVDPVLIDRLVRTADEHPSCDYISFCCADGKPALLSPVGAVAEWCRASALQRANRDAVDPLFRADVMRYVFSHPEVFNLRLITLPSEMDRTDVRLRVETEEDWEHVQQIFDALGPERIDWRQIAGLLDHSPHLRNRMAVLNQAAFDRVE